MTEILHKSRWILFFPLFFTSTKIALNIFSLSHHTLITSLQISTQWRVQNDQIARVLSRSTNDQHQKKRRPVSTRHSSRPHHGLKSESFYHDGGILCNRLCESAVLHPNHRTYWLLLAVQLLEELEIYCQDSRWQERFGAWIFRELAKGVLWEFIEAVESARMR